MRLPSLPNRDRTINELTRRFDEVAVKAEKGIHNDEEAQQFISLVAHYIYYVKKSRLTAQAVQKLFSERQALADDQILVDEADAIIERMKNDRDRLVRIARRRNINVDRFQFNTDGGVQQITGDMEVSFYLTFVDDFLDLPSDQQFIGNLPREISHLLSIIFAIQSLGGDTATLQNLRVNYQQIWAEYEKKLKMHGVYLDYLRVEDYKALEMVWRDVYQEGSRDEIFQFHLMYGDLFEKNRHYSQNQQREADEFIDKHITHLQRVHNYLIDVLEDVPNSEKFWMWVVEHFGPTFVSLLIIIAISLLLRWAGIHKGIDELRGLLGL